MAALGRSCGCVCSSLRRPSLRQDKEAWIKVKYVEKKFLKKLPGGEALAESERKPRRWCVKKCQRHNSGSRAPTARRKYRQETGNASPAMLSSGGHPLLGVPKSLRVPPEQPRSPSRTCQSSGQKWCCTNGLLKDFKAIS